MIVFRSGLTLACSMALLLLAGCGSKSDLVKPGDAKPPAKSAASKVPVTP